VSQVDAPREISSPTFTPQVSSPQLSNGRKSLPSIAQIQQVTSPVLTTMSPHVSSPAPASNAPFHHRPATPTQSIITQPQHSMDSISIAYSHSPLVHSHVMTSNSTNVAPTTTQTTLAQMEHKFGQFASPDMQSGVLDDEFGDFESSVLTPCIPSQPSSPEHIPTNSFASPTITPASSHTTSQRISSPTIRTPIIPSRTSSVGVNQQEVLRRAFETSAIYQAHRRSTSGELRLKEDFFKGLAAAGSGKFVVVVVVVAVWKYGYLLII
jgi:hypothetical protein